MKVREYKEGHDKDQIIAGYHIRCSYVPQDVSISELFPNTYPTPKCQLANYMIVDFIYILNSGNAVFNTFFLEHSSLFSIGYRARQLKRK